MSTTAVMRSPLRRDRSLEALTVTVLVGILTAVAALSLLVVPRTQAIVLAPMLALTFTVAVMWLVLIARGNSAPFFETGGFLATVVLVYGVYAGVGFLALGMRYTRGNDFRLQAFPPTAEQFGSILWWYAGFAAAFVIAYLLVRGNRPISVSTRRPARAILPVALVAFAAAKGALAAVTMAFGLASGGYMDEYRAIAALPTVLRQIFVHVQGMVPAIVIIVLVALFADFRKNRVWIGLILGAELIGVLRHLGARTELFILILSAAMLYHFCTRRIPLWLVLAGGAAALSLFLYLGYERSRGDNDQAFSTAVLFSNATEFEAIFGNAYDLRYVQGAAGAFRGSPSLWAADFIALIPQQLLPFAKTNGALWYLSEYYPAMASLGGGFAFGAVPEAIAGYGVAQLLFSAALLGVGFGLLHRLINRGRAGFWSVAAYVWLTVNSYQCFRNSSFSLLLLFVYHFVVPVVGIVGVASLMTRVKRTTAAALRSRRNP